MQPINREADRDRFREVRPGKIRPASPKAITGYLKTGECGRERIEIYATRAHESVIIRSID